MGAHTLGRLHVIQTLFRYTWKTVSGKLFNNGYFRNLVRKRDWYFPSDGDTAMCVKVGDAAGGRPIARWVPHVRGDNVAGGPVQWIQEKLVCMNYSTTSETPPTCGDSDLQWRFVVGLDESALPCEMGLYVDFQVDGNGIPSGCPGFEDFNLERWNRDPQTGLLRHHSYTWTRIDGQKAEPLCNATMIREPSDDEPTHRIIEQYADDAAAWLRDFFPALEKMLSNGYGVAGELVEAPAGGMTGFSCPLQQSSDPSRQYVCA
mmetsp:Transcript_59358/g.176579  ORF Transcript_59358/g.176579 Transcript_59358/m.176579 type:complete len:261 (-) Transcript_59358:92-874(-)